MALRFDRATYAKPTRTHQGFLRLDATFARTGILEYRRADGSVRRELRLPEECFAAETLASHEMAPLTLEHPPERVVTPDNAQRLTVGFVAPGVAKDGSLVRGSLIVTDAKAIRAIESRDYEQLSGGYSCDTEETPGVWEGKPYDAIQRNVRINHMALVKKGRAGDAVRVHLDSADAMEVVSTPNAGQSAPGHDIKSTATEPPQSAPGGGRETAKTTLDLYADARTAHADSWSKLQAAKAAHAANANDSTSSMLNDCREKHALATKVLTDCRSRLMDEDGARMDSEPEVLEFTTVNLKSARQDEEREDYDPDQARDENGRWAEEAGAKASALEKKGQNAHSEHLAAANSHKKAAAHGRKAVERRKAQVATAKKGLGAFYKARLAEAEKALAHHEERAKYHSAKEKAIRPAKIGPIFGL